MPKILLCDIKIQNTTKNTVHSIRCWSGGWSVNKLRKIKNIFMFHYKNSEQNHTSFCNKSFDDVAKSKSWAN